MVNARDCFRILLLLNGARSCRLEPQQQISNNKFKIQMNHNHKFQKWIKTITTWWTSRRNRKQSVVECSSWKTTQEWNFAVACPLAILFSQICNKLSLLWQILIQSQCKTLKETNNYCLAGKYDISSCKRVSWFFNRWPSSTTKQSYGPTNFVSLTVV